jgi:hypothetical protein
VKLDNEGLSLWYGTPDAPAPGDDGVVPRNGASLVVGVQPPNPTNTVFAQYRVDGGMPRTVPGRELRTDYARQAQYFAIKFPDFPAGELVEYSPVLSCGGRQVPPPHIASRFPSKFRLAAKDGRSVQPARSMPVPPREVRFDPGMSFLAGVVVQFGAHRFIGDTAAGMRVDFIVQDGTVEGEGLKGRVTDGSSDHLIVRRDGMGVVRIRAAFVLEDGAMLDIESGGYVDFGADGYRRALARNLPDRSPMVVTPLIATRHPKYRWLSRVQCVGVGYTHLDAAQVSYQVYAVSPHRLS